MKTMRPFLSIILLLVTINPFLMAAVWRVNNTPGSSPDYTSIQAAHDASTTQNGDTLYVEGAQTSYGSLGCTKSLVIIGTGYFLNENPQTQANTVRSYIDYVYFYAGSQGSTISGISSANLYLYDSDIIIERCYIANQYAVQAMTSNLSNIIIRQNYLGYYQHTSTVYFPYDCSNILITNNIIIGYISSGTVFSGLILNNVINGGITTYNAVIKNNILASYGAFTNYNNTFTHNLDFSTSFGTQDGNQSNVNMSTVFVGTGSTDGYYQLKAGSPAIGAGENGIDCGVFGGAYPYVLSGMPSIPSIYYISVPSIPTNVLDVAIRAKNHQ